MSIYGRVYVIICEVNGRQYVGQTRQTLPQRWAGHVYDALKRQMKTYFYNAVRKYGAASFKIALLEECEDRGTLDEREIHWINALETLEHGYNSKQGGDSHVWSAAARKRQSERQKGKPGTKHSEETKRRMSEIHSGPRNERFGKKNTAKSRAKTSATLKSIPHHLRGQRHTPEMLERFRQAKLGKVASEDSKRKTSESLRGKPKSEEHRARLSEAAKRWRAEKKRKAEAERDSQTSDSVQD